MAIVLSRAVPAAAQAVKPEAKAESNAPIRLKASGGIAWYRMSDFNSKLKAESNREIGSGLAMAFDLPVPLKMPKIADNVFIIPGLGLTYLGASSTTTHAIGTDAATVKWNLPVIGFIFAPEVSGSGKKHFWSFRPVGIGYYDMGHILRSRLSVSDRPGFLEITGGGVGFESVLGFAWKPGKAAAGLELGYRYLKLSDVTRTPREGFTSTPGGSVPGPSSLPQDLDYSGPLVRLFVTVQLGIR